MGRERSVASGQAVTDFEDLAIWQRAYALALEVYQVSAAFPAHAEPELRAQLCRAAGAVGGHIAEGFGRYSRAEYLRSLHSARGALMEARHFVRLARGLEYLSPEVAERLVGAMARLNAQLHRTVTALRERSPTVSVPDRARDPSDVDN